MSLSNIPLSELLIHVAQLAGGELQAGRFAYTIAPVGTTHFAAKSVGAAMEKAAAIVFPQIEFKDATLAETMEFFRIKAKVLDPAKTGVNLFLVPPSAGASPLITLKLRGAPLSEALGYVARLADYEMVANDSAITLQPSAK